MPACAAGSPPESGQIVEVSDDCDCDECDERRSAVRQCAFRCSSASSENWGTGQSHNPQGGTPDMLDARHVGEWAFWRAGVLAACQTGGVSRSQTPARLGRRCLACVWRFTTKVDHLNLTRKARYARWVDHLTHGAWLQPVLEVPWSQRAQCPLHRTQMQAKCECDPPCPNESSPGLGPTRHPVLVAREASCMSSQLRTYGSATGPGTPINLVPPCCEPRSSSVKSTSLPALVHSCTRDLLVSATQLP